MAEILSWSRSRGVFAGISLNGATLRQDEDDNAVLYGKKMTTPEVVRSGLRMPKEGRKLIRLLRSRSPREGGK